MSPEESGPTESSRRSAHATLRGYLYQVCLGVQRWLELRDGEVLVCEGDEDLDRRILGIGGGVFEQVKNYTGRLGLGDAPVVESLQHFLRSYVALRQEGLPGSYVFTTTAEPSRTRKGGLDFDLLQKWRDGDRSREVCDGVRLIVAGERAPEWVTAPAAWLDGEADGWKGFLDAVQWTFGAPDLDKVRGEISKRLAVHPALRRLPREALLERLVSEVLQHSSRPTPTERTLTRDDLARLADGTRTELEEWARTEGAPLRQVFDEVAALGRLLTDHTLALRENPTPGQLLTASYEVIPFHEAGREGELAALAEWCNSDELRDVLLLVGEGGTGKTRLAIEWCRRLRHQGWHAGFLRLDRKPDDLDPLLDGAAPRLIVIDYAETRLSVLTALLYKLALDRGTGPKVRLLLLSRRAGDWWEALREGRERAEIGDLLGRSQPREIVPLVPSEEERRSAFRAAAEGFALVLGRQIPKQLPEPPFENPDFERALYLHMAALASLEGQTIGSAADALTATLTHERRFWNKQVEEMRLDESFSEWMETALGTVMAAVTLTGEAEEKAARALFSRVLTPLAGRTDLIDLAFKRLRRLYGRNQDQGPVLEPLRPDLLGEELVAQELERDAVLLDRVLAGVKPREAQSALTVLTRLAQRREPAVTWLAAAFRGERLEQLAELALEVAVETGDPVGIVLAREVVERASGDLANLLMNRCGEDRYLLSVRLREVALASTQRCFALLPTVGSSHDEAVLVKRAGIVLRLGYRLSELGYLAEALSATQEAVSYYRALSVTRPGTWLPDLARSLNNLGNQLSDLGRREEALLAMEEAVEHCRAPSATRPAAASLADLATVLNNLSKMLSDLGRDEEALSASEEAVTLRRALATTSPAVFLPALASSLNNLGSDLYALGRQEEALSAAREAVEHYRALSTTRPDAFLPELATSLVSLGSSLSALGRYEEALLATEEAVALRRQLSATRPAVFLPDLAASLNHLGLDLRALGRYEDALMAAEEAVALRRTLSATRPDAFLPYLAGSLSNLGNQLSALDRKEEALSAIEEAVRILAPFFFQRPATFSEWMTGFARNYLQHSKAAGREPDRKLLAPLVEPLGLSLDPPTEPPIESPET